MVLLLWSPDADGLRVGGPLDASTPYLTDARLADSANALRFLSRFAHQLDLLRVLRVAIGAGSGFNPARDLEDSMLIRYAAEAVARGQIRVGEVLPARFAAYFDPRDPVASRLGFPVCVPDIAAGQAVLRALGESEGGEATLQAVLRHPAGSEWMLGRAANAQGPGLVSLCAELLALRALLLVPLSPTGRTMRLVWALRPSLQADSVAPQAPPPPRARAPSPPPPPPPAGAERAAPRRDRTFAAGRHPHRSGRNRRAVLRGMRPPRRDVRAAAGCAAAPRPRRFTASHRPAGSGRRRRAVLRGVRTSRGHGRCLIMPICATLLSANSGSAMPPPASPRSMP